MSPISYQCHMKLDLHNPDAQPPHKTIRQPLRAPWECRGHLGASGSLWEPLGASGSLWECPGASGSLWESLGASGSLWEPLGAPGGSRAPLGACHASRSFWAPQGARRSVWGPHGNDRPQQQLWHVKTIATVCGLCISSLNGDSATSKIRTCSFHTSRTSSSRIRSAIRNVNIMKLPAAC